MSGCNETNWNAQVNDKVVLTIDKKMRLKYVNRPFLLFLNNVISQDKSIIVNSINSTGSMFGYLSSSLERGPNFLFSFLWNNSDLCQGKNNNSSSSNSTKNNLLKVKLTKDETVKMFVVARQT